MPKEPDDVGAEGVEEEVEPNTEAATDEAKSKLLPGESIIEAFSRKTQRGCDFKVNFGANCQEAITKYGEDVVYSIFIAKADINAQARARTVLHKSDKTIEEAAEAGALYVPGITIRKKGVKVDPLKALIEDVKAGKRSKADLLAEISRALESEE